MRLPLEWMREFVAVPDDAPAVAARLAACGFEVASIEGGVIDFEITANRPDCLSVYGLAREAATAFDLDLKPAPPGEDRPGPPGVLVSIGDPGCPRYAAAVADVKIGPSPAWLADRLIAAGIRPINNVVDVTNYVMIETGHPMHAFDLAKLVGPEIHVRRARSAPVGMRIAQGLLAALCLLLGVLPTGFLGLIDGVPRELLGTGLPRATAEGWLWLTPISPQVASYSAPLVVLVLVAMTGLVLWVVRRGGVQRVRRRDAWDCGFGPPSTRMQYTATAFAQPIRRVFGPLFHIEESVVQREDGSLRHQLQVSDRAWGLFYLPVVHAVEGAARRVVRLQSGNVRVYLGWTLATLLVLLWITA